MNDWGGFSVEGTGCAGSSGVERRIDDVDSTVGSNSFSKSSGLSITGRSDSDVDVIYTCDG